jgi:hypothetical protein
MNVEKRMRPVDRPFPPTYKEDAAACYPGSTREGDDVEESQFRVSSAIAGEDEYVEFWPAGTLAKSQFSCTACGKRVTVYQVLPRCMVCGERLWERADWSPFARSEAPR